ncbi:hypothetical protein [Dyella sp.]|uniref:hypothetical protein n=1 Tax=Dyella sp. TaxID=1869338 RepID=UPI002D7957CF|nr:hypothetical protein [Dyella sp.]HET7332965.1 hypothetical protein [Dyella sp.]
MRALEAKGIAAMTISIHTLTMAILAVNAKVEELKAKVDVAEDPDLSHLEEELFDYSKAKMELKRMYIEEQKTSQNLLPYEKLLG